jgi:hypothetical protein
MNRPLPRTPDESQELVKEMRSLARAAEQAVRLPSSQSEERVACLRITTGLMLLLVIVLFATSALPDLLPRLDQVVAAGL